MRKVFLGLVYVCRVFTQGTEKGFDNFPENSKNDYFKAPSASSFQSVHVYVYTHTSHETSKLFVLFPKTRLYAQRQTSPMCRAKKMCPSSVTYNASWSIRIAATRRCANRDYVIVFRNQILLAEFSVFFFSHSFRWCYLTPEKKNQF